MLGPEGPPLLLDKKALKKHMVKVHQKTDFQFTPENKIQTSEKAGEKVNSDEEMEEELNPREVVEVQYSDTRKCFVCNKEYQKEKKLNLKNHILSHYYPIFYQVIPNSRPFNCPECEHVSRDRITLIRHVAFYHRQLYLMTDITPELLQDMLMGSSTSPTTPAQSSCPVAI